MNLIEVAHVVRAAAQITNEDEFVIIGSQAILGAYPSLDDEILTRSPEVDLYPRLKPELAEDFSGALGAGGAFHHEYGYYADAVGPETATLPVGWQDRLILIRDMESLKTHDGRNAIAYFLEPHDLLCSKFAAGRDKDYEFCKAAIARGIVLKDVLMERLKATSMHGSKRAVAQGIIESAFLKRE